MTTYRTYFVSTDLLHHLLQFDWATLPLDMRIRDIEGFQGHSRIAVEWDVPRQNDRSL